MAPPKSSFLDKVLGRIGRLDTEGLQTVVQRLARERTFLETLFNTIEDGVLVIDETGRIIYFNQAVTQLLGLQASVEGQPITDFLPELDWEKIRRLDAAGGQRVVRHEFEVHFPRPRFLRLYAAPLDGQATGSSGMALILHDATEARQQTFEAFESSEGLRTSESQAQPLPKAVAARGIPLSPLKMMWRKWAESSSNMLRWPKARSTGWITLSRNFYMPSAQPLPSSNPIHSTRWSLKRSSCSNRNWRTAGCMCERNWRANYRPLPLTPNRSNRYSSTW